MKLNEFICGNADAELMKSLYQNHIDSGKEPSEELLKAMNKAGLVQVQRTVNGKHGTFTRMQWVKSSDVKDSDKVVGGKNPEEEQEQVSKMKEEIKNKYAGAKTYVDRTKIDIEHVEKVRGIKFPEEERKKRLAFAEHLDKKYGDKKISSEEYGNELKEFYNASSPTSNNSTKKDKSSDTNKGKTESPKAGSSQSFRLMRWGLQEMESIKELVQQVRHNGTESKPAKSYNMDDISKVNEQLAKYCDKHGMTENGAKLQMDEKGRVYAERKDGSKLLAFKLNPTRQGFCDWGTSARGLENFLTTRGRAFKDQERNNLCRELYGVAYYGTKGDSGLFHKDYKEFGMEKEEKITEFDYFNKLHHHWDNKQGEWVDGKN